MKKENNADKVKENKKILIIRSVSFQQLDKNLVRIQEELGCTDTLYYLLTHSHGTNRAGKYKMFAGDGIIDYNSRRNFTWFHLPKRLRRDTFDAVVVPVTNKSGVGFLNVFLMAMRIKAKKIYCCNLVSDIWEMRRGKIFIQWMKSWLFSLVAGILTVVTLILFPFMLAWGMVFGKKK